MTWPEGLRMGGWRTAALGASIAGLGTFGYSSFTWLRTPGGPPPPDWPLGTLLSALVGIAVLTALGAAAGLISGRYRYAAATWAAALIGAILSEQLLYTIDPGWPQSEDGLWGSVIFGGIFLMPFSAGGHLIGVWARAVAVTGKANRVMVIASLALVLAGIAAGAAIILANSPYADGRRPASPAEIATALGAKGLPSEVAGLQLRDTAMYVSTTAGNAYYAIWSDNSHHEIQIVLSTQVPSCGPQDGFEDDRGQAAFRVFDRDQCLQILAPDVPSLRAVVAAVLPDLAARLEQEIAHPSTP